MSPDQITTSSPGCCRDLGSEQTAQATVYAPGPIGTGPEVEVHLHKTITPTSNLGYEILHSITGSGSGDYMLIVKGITTPPYYRILFTNVCPRYSVKTGDVVKATIAGNVITSYKNGVQERGGSSERRLRIGQNA
jgi:hypothetical protein